LFAPTAAPPSRCASRREPNNERPDGKLTTFEHVWHEVPRMELLNKGLAPLVELFKSMTPGARITAALLLVVTAVSIAYLFQQPLDATHVYLMGGGSFTPAELRDMQAALGKAGLVAELDGARIRIPRGQEARYMAALDEADALPAKPGHHMEKALNSGGFLRIPHGQQAAAELVAKQQELQGLIDGMRGVEHSAVLIDSEESTGFPRPKKVVTAAVAVWPEHAQPLDRETIQTIRQLLVSSISGLQGDTVTVIDMNSNAHFTGNQAPSAGGDYAERKKRHELQWQHTIAAVLSYIPGVLVSTTVELGPAGQDAAGADAPQRVTASVQVPHAYLEQVWRKEHAPAGGSMAQLPDEHALADVEARETQRIERLVSNLLPRDTGAGPRVAVSTFHPLGEPPTAEQQLREHAFAWLLAHWQTVSLAGLALVGLLVLRSMFRSVGRDAQSRGSAATVGLPPTLSLVSDAFDDDSVAPSELFDRRSAAGATLSSELADAVRNDPDAAVSVLRTWIGNAS
ncbi:MAG: hypothetical protein WD845_04250, partial [Pirellulales bacterium]